MSTLVKRTFAGGELSPSIFMRGDTQKYQTGFELGRNFLVSRDGTLINRQGTGHVATNKNAQYKSRFIDWIFNNNLSYVLELGHNYMRFFKNGVQIEVSPAVWDIGTIYNQGETVSYSGVNYYALLFQNQGQQPDIEPDYWYPLTDSILEMPTPWTEDEIFDVKYDQQGDVMHLVQIDSPPQMLSRFSDTHWTTKVYRPVPDVSRDVRFDLFPPAAAGSILHKYAITMVTQDYEEGQTIGASSKNFYILGVSQTNPIIITTGTTETNGERVHLFNTGIPELDNQTFVVSNASVGAFEIQVDGTGFPPAALGYGMGLYDSYVGGTPTAADTARCKVSMSYMYNAGYRTGDIRYCNVYKDIGYGYGYIGSLDIDLIDNVSVVDYSFYDDGIEPELSIRPPELIDYFGAPNNYPSTVQFVQQRLSFASSINKAQTMWLSRIGFYNNFTTSYKVSANDAINFIISGRSINKIEHIVDATNIIVLTQGGEFIVAGDQNGTIRPTTINANQIGYEGADKIQPIVIGSTIFYIQARSKQIRAIGFNNSIKGFDPSNLTKFADHLFKGKQIVDWAFQRLPDSQFWMVLDDGSLITMTFVVEEGILAFTHHDTDGVYESVTTVPEGNDDIVYVGVKREINGSDQRSLERMAVREIDNIITDAYFMDNYSAYDGTNTTADTMTLTSGGTWGVDDGPFNLADSGGSFVSGDVGNIIVLNTVDDSLTCTLTAFVDANNFTVDVSKDVPVAFQGVALATWGKGISSFAGNTHLANKTVSVYADGSVQPQVTADGAGLITITDPAVVVRYGLPYTSEMVTLDFEIAGQETLLDKRKNFNTMHMMVQDTRGGWSGPKDAKKMYEIKQLKASDVNTAEDMLINGLIENVMQAVWQNTGSLRIEQRDPLPMHLLGLIPAGRIGGA